MTTPVRYHLGQFPPRDIKWEGLVPLIGKANAALARYDGLVAAVPNAALLLSPLMTQEAVLSSKIEGTTVTMGEVLEIEAGAADNFSQTFRDDVEEINNYRAALSYAAKAVAERLLTPHLLREAHAMLMRGVRGENKDPGAFRTQQNWIGTRGCSIDEASFVPIAQEHLLAGIDLWASYVAGDAERDPLVQLAIVHAEFEALHPFKDGNGRLGRMIIPLFLFERKLLSGPNFYMSGYLETHRDEYIERLRAISRDGAWTAWCAFFLQGVVEQALENRAKAQAIVALHKRMLGTVAELTRSQFAGKAVDFLFSRPVFSSTHFIAQSQIPRPTALRFLSVLRDAGILRPVRIRSGRRPSIFLFTELLTITEGRVLA